MGIYYILDFIITVSEVAGLYLIYIHLCKIPRFSSAFWKFFPVCANFCVAWMTTWLTSLGAYKLFFNSSGLHCLFKNDLQRFDFSGDCVL